MPSANLSVLNLFVRHGTEKYPRALESLGDYYRTRLPGVARTLIVIDNSLPPNFSERMSDGTLVMGGSNDAWEFSAWDSAIERCRRDFVRYDYVHLVTSAFGELYTAYIGKLDEPVLRAVRGMDVAVGHIDAYDQPVRLMGRTSQAWLRSSFIFLPPAALRRLGSVVSVADRRNWFSGNPEQPFRTEAALCERYRAQITGWLTGEGTGQGTTWHSRFALTTGTLAFFEAKALAILNEHALSMRLYGQGTSMVDATWLSSALKSDRWRDSRPTALYDWRQQLVERRPYL